jgi:hypothetical protein
MTGKERISAGTHGTRLDDGKVRERPFSRWRIKVLDSYLLFFRALYSTVFLYRLHYVKVGKGKSCCWYFYVVLMHCCQRYRSLLLLLSRQGLPQIVR